MATYKTYKPKSLDFYKQQYSTYTPKTFGQSLIKKPPNMTETLQTQKENLQTRLEASGVNPDDLASGEFDNRGLIERALNLTPDQGLMMDIFEIVDRPVQAVKLGLLEGGEGVLKGITGEEEIQGVEFLDELGIVDATNLTGVEKFGLNLLTDFALDPLTYFSPIKFIGEKTGLFSRRVTRQVDYEQVIKRTGDVANEAVERTIREQGADVLKGVDGYVDKSTGLEIVEDTQLRKQIDLETKVEIDERLNQKAAPGATPETIARNGSEKTLNNSSDALGGEILVRKGRTANNAADLTLYRKVEVDGLTYWVKFENLEVKGLVGAQLVLEKGETAAKALRFENAQMFPSKGAQKQLYYDATDNAYYRYSDGAYKKVQTKAVPSQKVQGVQPTVQVTEAKVKVNGIDEDVVYFDLSDDFMSDFGNEIEFELQQYFRSEGIITQPGETVWDTYRRLLDASQSKGALRQEYAERLAKETKGRISATSKTGKYSKSSNAHKAMSDRSAYYRGLDDAVQRGEITSEDAQTIRKLYKEFTEKTKTLGKGNVTQRIPDNEEVRRLFSDILLKDRELAGNPYIAFVDEATGEVKHTHIESIIDTLDFNGSDFAIEGNALRMKMRYGSNITLNDIPDDTDEMIAFLMDEKLKVMTDETITKTATVTYMEEGKILRSLRARAADKSSILSKPAQFALDVRDYTRKLFNVNADFNVEFESRIGAIEGGNAQKLFDYQTRTNNIALALRKVDPDAGARLSRLVENVEYIDDTTVKFIDRTVDAKDVINNFVNNAKRGTISTSPTFESAVAEQNYLKKLNDILKQNNIDGTEFVIKRGASGGMVLDLKGDFDLEDISSILTGDGAIFPSDRTLTFGTRQLDPDDIAFYRNNKDLIDEYNAIKGSVEDLLVTEIGLENLPIELRNKMGYLRHSLSDEAKDQLQKTAKATQSRTALEGSNPFQQRNQLGSIEEVNAALRDFGNLPYDQLTDDAFEATGEFIQETMTIHRQQEVMKAVLEGSLIQEAAGLQSFAKIIPDTKEAAADLGKNYRLLNGGFEEEFSKMYRNLSPDAQKQVDEFFKQMGYEKGKAIAMNNSVYELIARTNQAYVDLPNIVKNYDSFLNYWKSITLVSPGFHVRNFFGNTTNMYVVGMNVIDIPRYTKMGFTDINIYRRNYKRVLEEGKDFLSASDRILYDQVEYYYMNGIGQTRKGIRDLEKLKNLVLEGVDPSDPQYKQLYQRLVKANFDAAEYMDDVQRYAMFRWSLDNGDFSGVKDLKRAGASEEVIKQHKLTMARKNTMDALFDYSALTTAEREYMKRLFPFYTFMKNNLVFQAKSMLKNPGKYARLGRAYDYWNEDIGGIATEDLPEYMQDNMWLPVPMEVTKDDEQAISFLKLNLPPSDFAEIVEQPFQRGVASISAPIKLAIELGTGRDTFTGQEIQEFSGETSRMQEGEGALGFVRDERGNFAISSNPYVQKVFNDLGLRVPRNYMSIALDVIDGIIGYQTVNETSGDILSRLSVTGTQSVSNLEMTRLYQDLQQLRDLRSLYEQETQSKLPTLDELGLGN